MFPSLFKYNLKRSNHRLTDAAPTYCQQKFFFLSEKNILLFGNIGLPLQN